ncbi:hypothetical protein FOZ62_012262, partial [Perkinsus olseni]
ALWYAMLTVNSTIRASGASAAELVMGSPILTPSAALVGSLANAPECEAAVEELRSQVDPSTVDPVHIQVVVDRLLQRERVKVLEVRVREAVRRMASGRGNKRDITDVDDGALVVWRRPEAMDVEGHVVKLQGVDVSKGPYVYLGRMAGFSTHLQPLGAPPSRTVAVSPCHLEVRREAVDRTRPTPAVEATVDLKELRDGDCVLVRLVTGADVLGLYRGPSLEDDVDSVGVVHVLDSPEGCRFITVFLEEDGTTIAAKDPPAGAVPLLRSFAKVMAKIRLTPTGLLSRESRELLVNRGYLE